MYHGNDPRLLPVSFPFRVTCRILCLFLDAFFIYEGKGEKKLLLIDTENIGGKVEGFDIRVTNRIFQSNTHYYSP